MRITAKLALLVGATALAIGACGGTPTIASDKLEKSVSEALTKQVGQKPDKIACPHDLEAKVGKKARCVLTASGTRYGVSVKITSVSDDNRAKFDIEVDQKPMK